MAFKPRYSFEEWYGEHTKGTPYQSYAKANPIEAAKIDLIAGRKIRQEPYFMPVDIAKTHEGMSIVMMIVTLSAVASRLEKLKRKVFKLS